MNAPEEVDLVEDAECSRSVDHAARKRRIVMMLLAYSAILGVISCFLPEEASALDGIVSLPILILGISWCFADAAQRGHRIGRLTIILLIFLFIVGLPIYLFQTRGIGAVKTLASAMMLVGAMIVCMCLAVTATCTLALLLDFQNSLTDVALRRTA